MNRRRLAALAAALLALSGCGAKYALVPPAPVSVAKGGMTVTPGMAWNRIPKGGYDIAWEENWTENGPLLDSMGFVAGLPDGQAIAKQRKKDDRKVPVFRADMSPQDLVSMIESFYRIKAGATVFTADAVAPATFLGRPGLQFDYSYVGGDQVGRRGRAVMAVVDGKFYLASLDGTALHYFDAALPEFTAVTQSARLG
ncbi:hypothetical protein [Sphingomonas sp. Leaf412]|uniref:hypothetical protein n=1 Tax=Sphingomonas sp. Leaf412 TaxID=1736370 RepID=UPI000A3F2D1B|nr:hypothetical protein [Sphingomonas sp. Leaf412]